MRSARWSSLRRSSTRAALALAFSSTTLACGGAAIQRAAVSMPSQSARASIERESNTTDASPSGSPTSDSPGSDSPSSEAPPSDVTREENPGAPRFIVTSKGSRFELSAQTPMGREQFTFRQFTAHATGHDSPIFHARIETASLVGGPPGLSLFVRNELLEVDRYPRATFDGSVARGPDGECIVTGILKFHGVSRELRFKGMLYEEGDGLRLAATFDVPRRAFGISAHGPIDAFIPDDVRVSLDVLARLEQVRAEELP